MRILHTGDIHLDTPFSGLGNAEAQEMRRELRNTFSKMMRYAAETKVDMVLIAGDLFDNEFVTRETVGVLRREFSALSCPVVISPGNHDCADASSIWRRELLPDNVCIFTDEGLCRFPFDDLGVDVYGFAFNSKFMQTCPIDNLKPERPDRINILLAHGDTTNPLSQSCPLPLSAIRAFGADWCALGHIHNPEAANAALGKLGAYCGCPMGRDFGEIGNKSANIINIEKTAEGVSVDIERIGFSRIAFRLCDVDVTGMGDFPSVCSAVLGAVDARGYKSTDLVRIRLCGNVDPALMINCELLAEQATGLKYVEAIDLTLPVWNSELLERDQSIRGEVYRSLLPKLGSEDPKERECAANALRLALAALAGEL